jgi:transcription antitermination factor NusG
VTGQSTSGWFAVWTRSQCEAKVEEALRRKSFEVLLPRVRVPSRRRDRRLVLEQPLFPGYLFLRFSPAREKYVDVAGTDGVVRILGERWDALTAVPDDQVDAVRRVVTDAAGARPLPWVKVGNRVRLMTGPLAGLEGLVQGWHAGRATFVVSVDLLRRSVGVEVDASAVERV